MKKQEKEILELLKEDSVSKIVLTGGAGVGKTFMARKISDHAISEPLCHSTIWLSLNRKYDTALLYENIAQQLHILSSIEEWEDDDIVKEKEEKPKDLKRKISEELNKRRSKVDATNKYLLLILDDEGHKMNEKEIMLDLQLEALLAKDYPLKLLITRRQKPDISNEDYEEIEFGLWNEEELSVLLQKHVDSKVSNCPPFAEFSKEIVSKSKGLPAAIIVIAETLNYMARNISEVPRQELEKALEEATCHEKIPLSNASGEAAGSNNATGSDALAGPERVVEEVSPLIQFGYKMLRSDVVLSCFWHCWEFFGKYGSVHFNELIANWILEGYFAPVFEVRKAYEDGHSVLMELIDRGLLKMEEDNFIVPERAAMDMIDLRYRGSRGAASLGLTSVLEDDKWRSLWRITRKDGMIKTPNNGRKEESISTMLIDGSHLRWKIPESFLNRMQNLEVLGLFQPRFKSLPLSFFEMDKLHVLVLRDCDLLSDIKSIANLRELTVLEISGANSLKEIPDIFFDKMPHLQILNLSALPITSLPSSFSDLRELRRLILRQCSRLKTLPNVQFLENLEVLDLHGANSLQKFTEKNKNFSHLQKLQLLDMSYSKIDRIPIFGPKNSRNPNCLTHLLLRGCDELAMLPSLQPLRSLQILDLSGAIKIIEIKDECFLNKPELKILDLSNVPISRLPSYIGNLYVLRLKACSNLVELPCLEGLKDLESLDLSETSSLKNLPSLSKLRSLRHLLLKGCSSLENLPTLEGLTSLENLDLSCCRKLVRLPQLSTCKKLEVLDLSGCCALTTINGSFKLMSRLHKLNLSDTQIESLPALCSPSNLLQLILRNCSSFKELPQPEFLSKLKELDLGGAISLGDIKGELWQHMTHLETLNLSGVLLKEFSFISSLMDLTHLSLTIHSGFITGAPIGELTKLKVLHLSEASDDTIPINKPANIHDVSFIGKLNVLSELSLQGCSSLKVLPPIKSRCLEVLDLSGTGIKEFPYEITELTSLKRFVLPDLKIIQEADWTKIKSFPEELCWECSNNSEASEIISRDGKCLSVLQVKGTQIFQLLRKNPNMWEKFFSEFYISVCLKGQDKGGDMHFQRDIHAYEDIYFKIRSFQCFEKRSGWLEIHGSGGTNGFPDGVSEALSRAEYISLIDNMSVSCSSVVGADNMRGCWLERCNEMKKVFDKKVGDATFGEKLEILWVSNLPKLDSVFSASLRSECFQNLKHLHLDCCPMLKTLFHPHQLPISLETLQIKFCDKLKSIFDYDILETSILPNLETLYLLELPEVESVGVMIPSLKRFDARNCPKLKDTKESLKCLENFEESTVTETKPFSLRQSCN